MGEVFLADQMGPLGPLRPVALKRMLPKMADDPRAARMFLDEMATAAQLNHPNIASVYDFGEVGGVYFIAMEYVDGLTLNDLVASLGPLPVAATLSIGAAVADALAYAHNRKTPSGEVAPVVHRDVSPHNVMVSQGGMVKLLDFGIARAEQAALGGKIEGKLAYAAPEQLQGEPADRRSDLWALGVVLYEALTAARPFEGENLIQLLTAALRSEFAPLSSRRPEAAVADPLIQRALLRDRDQRWPGAEAFHAACIALIDNDAPARSAQLEKLVAQAGGPKKSSTGVEALTNAGLARPVGATATVDFRAFADTAHRPDGLNSAAIPSAAQASPPRPLVDPRVSRVSLDPPARSLAPGILVGAGILIATLLAGTLWLGFQREEGVVVVGGEEPSVVAPVAETSTIEARAPAERAAPPEPPRVEAPRPAPTEPPERRAPHKRHEPSRRSEPRPAAASPAPKPEAHGLGLLSVRAIPYCRVLLDGKPLANSPLVNVPIQDGPHVLRLEPSDEKLPAKTAKIQVHTGLATRVVVDFSNGSVSVKEGD
jgi:serine/threonine-protein kinase